MALDIRIAGRYRLGRKIGSGSFGDIYLGKKAHSDSPCSTTKNFCESAFWLTSQHLQVYTFTLGRRLASSWCALALPLTYATLLNNHDMVFTCFLLQESIKTKHPQLLYESKLYKILQGGSEFTACCLCSAKLPQVPKPIVCDCSWNSQHPLVWSRG